jgi:molecular chaperone GrpE
MERQAMQHEVNQFAQSIDAQTGAASEVAQLNAENERLAQELRREHEMYVRCLADFDNYRRRAERERAQAAQAGKRTLLLPLLEVMDDFDRALAHGHEDPATVVVGLHTIQRRLEGLLAAEGVTAIESRGKYFDPFLHEAVGTAEAGGGESGTVCEEVSRGWRWGNDLLRPARVRVAQ